MIRRPPRSTLDRSSAASDVYKRQVESANENIAIGAPVAGLVAKVFVEPGDKIKPGDPLFTIDDRTLQATKPVSYTHLRAHETVLDLVCRLLLEKKKKKHDTPFDQHNPTHIHQC